MKRLAYSLLLCSLISGCMHSATEVSVYKKDGSMEKYMLLSVRDSSIVFMPSAEYFPSDDSYSHAMIIPDSSIVKIIRPGPSTPYLYPIFGGVEGAFFGYEQSGSRGIDKFKGMITGAAVGAAAGAVIVYLLKPQEKTFDLARKEDREALKDLSRYNNGEPSELQNRK
jgi:hypothetical protein